MLLSADWFFPYWGHIGFWFSEDTRRIAQRDARVCTEAMINGATEYWGVSFSEERVKNTAQAFFYPDAVGEIRDERRRMKVICDQVLFANKPESRATLWLLDMITEDVIRNQAAPNELDPALLEMIKRAFSNVEGVKEKTDFEELALESKTSWDLYLRGLTPDLPTYLSDWVSELIQVAKAQAFWLAIFDMANQRQLREIVDWYSNKGRELGAEVDTASFPAWLRNF